MKCERFKKIFIVLSIIFILSLMVIYSYRLIHFYKLENGIEKNFENYFSDKLEKTINVTDANGGLYIIEEEYIYKYNVTDNYLWYSGNLWRILKINEDKTMDIIMDDSISILNASYENTNYIEDYINDFYNKLDKDLLVELEYCSDSFNDINEIKCENKTKSNITLLDIYTYNKAGGNASFINNNESFWLINKTDNGDNWYINNGTLSIGEDINSFGIRPVVRIKNQIEFINGNGTKENPYVIKNNTNMSIGEYVNFNNDLWRIINLDDKLITISKEECLKQNDECFLSDFGTNSNYLESTLYTYLNKTYYDSIDNKDFVVKTSFEVGDYINYNYKNTSLKTIDAFVGLNKVGDYYINNKNTYLLTTNEIQSVYSVNENSNYYLTFTNEQKKIYPVLSLDASLKIKSGNGTINNPYKLSR